MKKTLSFILSLIMVFTLTAAFSMTAFADEYENTYSVSTPEDYIALIDKSFDGDTFENDCITLENDIEVSICQLGYYYDTPFMGTFKGNGNTVKFNDNDESFKGMFGYIQGAVIEDLTVEGNIRISYDEGGNGVAGIAGTATNSKITGCTFKGSIENEYDGADFAAGICGTAEGTVTISDCVNYANITGSGDYLSGILAYSDGDISVKDCANYGKIKGNSYISGILGYSEASFKVNHCINAGSISAAVHAGGILNFKSGSSDDNLELINCINRGQVSSTAKNGYAAGIAGYTDSTAKSLSILNSVNYGEISAKGRSGGILAYWSTRKSSINLVMKNCGNAGQINGSSIDSIIGYYSKKTADVVLNIFYNSAKCSANNLGATDAAASVDVVNTLNAFIDENSDTEKYMKWAVGNIDTETGKLSQSGSEQQAVFEKDIQSNNIGSVLSEGSLWIIIAVAVVSIGAVAALVVKKKRTVKVTASNDDE